MTLLSLCVLRDNNKHMYECILLAAHTTVDHGRRPLCSCSASGINNKLMCLCVYICMCVYVTMYVHVLAWEPREQIKAVSYSCPGLDTQRLSQSGRQLAKLSCLLTNPLIDPSSNPSPPSSSTHIICPG